MSDLTKKMADECIAVRVRMLNRVVTGIFEDSLRASGIKLSQFSILCATANRQPVKPAELAKVLELDESTLSRNVERIAAKGWLRLDPDDDRRSHLISVTEKGHALIRKAYPAWEKAQLELNRQLGAGNVAALRTITKQFRP